MHVLQLDNPSVFTCSDVSWWRARTCSHSRNTGLLNGPGTSESPVTHRLISAQLHNDRLERSDMICSLDHLGVLSVYLLPAGLREELRTAA